MDKVRALNFFLATVDSGSFAAAAKKFATDPSTVSKAVQRLESNLGIQLFQRSTRRLQLTWAGQSYAVTARRVLEELQGCEERLKQENEEPAGLLRINSPISYGRRYIRPLLTEFRRLYPKIDIEIQFNDAYVDMIAEGFDISIRSGVLQDSSLVARQLSPIDFLICGSDEYLSKHGRPDSEEALLEHAWIRFRFKQTGKLFPLLLQSDQGLIHRDTRADFVVDDSDSMAELCAQGLGITQIPHFIARDWLHDNRICVLFPPLRHPDMGVYLYYPKREFLPRKVRVFIDFLIQATEQSGEGPRHLWTEKLI
ncbi:MAG: LysR substrate-binding domain-containing protein [Motiliproteus sp.]|nr:LysR substrate-binding domain-containing protein [Motiliproteus sp.]MCW9053265.1 LysR substrate-binding domain-containing protein [Motiliproteus sp.]